MNVSADPVDFDEAIAWFAAKLSLTKDAWLALTQAARRKAFIVANVASADVVQSVHDSLDRALRDGTSFDDWAREIGPALEDAWAGTVEQPAFRLETIFRTNVQNAYGSGRYAQLTEPDIAEARPYWVYDAILDGRTTDECRALHGTVMPADDPWWNGRIPPIHFNCRSNIRSLRAEQAKRERRFGQQPPVHRGQDGFGAKPSASEWEPDLGSYAPDVRHALGAALSRDPAQVLPDIDLPE